MARIRTIKPEFFSHELLASKSAHARLLAIGLLTMADCKGRLRWVPMQVHAQVFPWEASVKIEVLLGELIDAEYVVHYEVDGKQYVEICNFIKHQRLSGKEAQFESRLPGPSEKVAKTLRKQVPNESLHSEEPVKHQDASPGRSGEPLGTGEQGNRGNSICSEPALRASEPSFDPSSCRFPVFPCTGSQKTWEATATQLSEWAAAYPAVDIQSEHRRAHAWIMANLSKRKTASGMAAYLVKWFARTQNSGGSPKADCSETVDDFRPPSKPTRTAGYQPKEAKAS